MNSNRAVTIFAIAVAVMVGAVVWFLRSDPMHRDSRPSPEAVHPIEAPINSTVATPEPAPGVAPAAKPDASPVPILTADDRKIDAILRQHSGNTDQDRSAAAQSLINLLPTLANEAQVTCAHHIADLVPEKDYGRVMQIWRNPATSREVLDVFAADIATRDNRLKLPAMLDALRQPSHPFHSEAGSMLRITLGGDFGNDFGKWEGAVQAFLQREDEAKRVAPQPGTPPPATPQ